MEEIRRKNLLMKQMKIELMQLAVEKKIQENQQLLQLRVKKLKVDPLLKQSCLLVKQLLQLLKERITTLKVIRAKNQSQKKVKSLTLNQITTVNLTRRKRKKPEKENLKQK